MEQLPLTINSVPKASDPLFPFGFGLSYGD
jgi:hypothetical protein